MSDKPGRVDTGTAVVVTGAGSGIGRALVPVLLARGVHVVACDRDVDALLPIGDARLALHRLDVRNEAAVASAVEAVPEGCRIAGLVACAAIFRRVPFLQLPEEEWDATFEVNLTGSLIACRAVLPRMRAQGGGSIVLVSSSLARSGSPTGAHYAATKGGILGLARSLALEVAREGIRVNVVSPGLIDTPQPRAHPGGAAAMFERAHSIPLGRIGETGDVVDAIEFLLGEESSFVTGQDLRVNGGGQIG